MSECKMQTLHQCVHVYNDNRLTVTQHCHCSALLLSRFSQVYNFHIIIEWKRKTERVNFSYHQSIIFVSASDCQMHLHHYQRSITEFIFDKRNHWFANCNRYHFIKLCVSCLSFIVLNCLITNGKNRK